jgi:hypothetical protein
MAVFLIIFSLIKARRRPQLTISVILPLALFLTCLIFFRFWPQKPLSATNLTWDFAQMGYLHHDEAGVPFDNGTVLQYYEYDRETVPAGEKLSITFGFSAADGDVVTVALGTPAIAWPAFDPVPPLIAEQTQIMDGQNFQFDFLLPDNVPAGLIIPRVTIKSARPLTPSGQKRGDIYLRPLRIVNDQPATRPGSELDVQAKNVQERDPSTLDIQLAWSTQQQMSHNYNVSLRLLDEKGNWRSQLDAQPGYGFLPSSDWPVGFEVNDWLAMPLPQDLPVETPLALVLRLYDFESGEVVLSRRLGEIKIQEGQLSFQENKPVFSLPDDLIPLPVLFGETIQLHGYQIDQTGTDLHLTFYWEALASDLLDYTRFVHFFDPETETVVAQNDGQPRSNSYSTSQWTAGEIVADTITFDLADVPGGSYQIGVGFYRQEGESLLHLTAVDPETKTTYEANRALLPDEILK